MTHDWILRSHLQPGGTPAMPKTSARRKTLRPRTRTRRSPERCRECRCCPRRRRRRRGGHGREHMYHVRLLFDPSPASGEHDVRARASRASPRSAERSNAKGSRTRAGSFLDLTTAISVIISRQAPQHLKGQRHDIFPHAANSPLLLNGNCTPRTGTFE